MKSIILLFACTTCLAGEFINLTFDEPDLSGPLTPIYPGGPLEGNTSQLLRGWTATADGATVASMTYSPYPLGSGGGPFNLMGNSPEEASGILGANSLLLLSLFPFPPELRIQQTGMVPSDAVGLWIGSAGYIQMYVNGDRIDDPRIGTHGNVVVDISKYSGSDIDLEFLVRPGDLVRFDILGWVSVPEPSTWALLGLGFAALFWRVRRQR